jgi:FlaA1/EpsC-like NDP-sugar epimerase
MLGVADVAAVAIGCAALAPATGTALWGLAIMPVWIVLAKLFGLYDRDQMVIRHQTFDEVPRIAGWVAVGTAALGAIPYLAPVARLTVGNAVTIWFVTAVLATAFRAGARWLWRRVTPPERTCVIGDGELAESARRKIELFKDMHLELVDGHSWRAQAAANGDARAVVAGVDRIIVASQHVDATWIGELAGVCRERRVKLSVISPLRGRAGAMPRLSEVADLPVLEYDTRDVSQITMLLKRAFDVVTSVSDVQVPHDAQGSRFHAPRIGGAG